MWERRRCGSIKVDLMHTKAIYKFNKRFLTPPQCLRSSEMHCLERDTEKKKSTHIRSRNRNEDIFNNARYSCLLFRWKCNQVLMIVIKILLWMLYYCIDGWNIFIFFFIFQSDRTRPSKLITNDLSGLFICPISSALHTQNSFICFSIRSM